jgi:hypothetical protein
MSLALNLQSYALALTLTVPLALTLVMSLAQTLALLFAINLHSYGLGSDPDLCPCI